MELEQRQLEVAKTARTLDRRAGCCCRYITGMDDFLEVLWEL